MDLTLNYSPPALIINNNEWDYTANTEYGRTSMDGNGNPVDLSRRSVFTQQ